MDAFGVDRGQVAKAAGKWGARLLSMNKSNPAETRYVTAKLQTALPGLRSGKAGRGPGQNIKRVQQGTLGAVAQSPGHTSGLGTAAGVPRRPLKNV